MLSGKLKVNVLFVWYIVNAYYRQEMHMEYKYILFDLDGTLTDLAIGITNSIMYALRYFGIIKVERSELTSLIGPPLNDAFLNYFSFTQEEAKKAVELYREYYSEKGIYENEVYPGICEMLINLKSKNKKFILATTKPICYAEKILKHFNLLEYFDFIAGSNMDGSRSDKSEIIQFAIDSLHITEKREVVMVGDRKHDVIGSRKCNIKSIGVLYGYGDKNELEGADFIVETVSELGSIL